MLKQTDISMPQPLYNTISRIRINQNNAVVTFPVLHRQQCCIPEKNIDFIERKKNTQYLSSFCFIFVCYFYCLDTFFIHHLTGLYPKLYHEHCYKVAGVYC